MNATITPSKPIPAGQFCTGDEAENIIQAFGIRLLDWRRFTDDYAAEVFAGLMRKYGEDRFIAALARCRRLAGRDRAMWLSAITVAAPSGFPNLMQVRPVATDDQIWQLAFRAFLNDETSKRQSEIDKLLRDLAIAEAI